MSSYHHKKMHQLSHQIALHYFLYTPSQLKPNANVLVAVHGISRNARKQARLFAKYAEKYGVVVVAPLFDKQHYAGYQRLGLSGERADLALNEILNEVALTTQANTQNIYLFGYSGGGQFVHRYAMAYPKRVKAMAIGAAGWYTLPTIKKRFPYGIAPHPKLPDLTFNAAQFLRIPAYVLVGEEDVLRDSALRKSEKLDQQQGLNRFERGQNWVKTMKQAAQQYGLETPFQFISLPNSDHSFSRSVQTGGMAKHVFQAFFGEIHATTSGRLQPRKNAPSIISYSQLNHALSSQFL
ncbi:MAG: hypothetical protein L3J01_02990 [Thiomicrorhabdus sp.]|nr:hypothetical protein [Thiomicrorhabdus sp.]